MQTIDTVIAALAAVLGETKHGVYEGNPCAAWPAERFPVIDAFVHKAGYIRIDPYVFDDHDDVIIGPLVIADGPNADAAILPSFRAENALATADAVFAHAGIWPVAVPLAVAVECARRVMLP